MDMIVGPILKRSGGYVFDTWSEHEGMVRGYPYRRIEDAVYARKAALHPGSLDALPEPTACYTVDEFMARTATGASTLA